MDTHLSADVCLKFKKEKKKSSIEKNEINNKTLVNINPIVTKFISDLYSKM